MKRYLLSVFLVLPLASYADISSTKYVDNIAKTKADDSKVVHLSGANMDDGATIKFTTYGNRFVTISGNSIVADVSQAPGGWAGSFASVKDPTGDSTTMLGWYGGTGGLNYIYMGGSYSSPAMKMTKAGDFTFAKPVVVGAPTDDNTTSKQADTVGARNTKINSVTSKVEDKASNSLVSMWIE